MKIYTIGAMTHYTRIGETEKMFEWRIKSKEYLNSIGIDIFDPSLFFEKNSIYDPKCLLPQNKLYARECQMALCNLEYLEYSGGSVWELGAFSIQDKPIIAFGRTEWERIAHIRDSISIAFNTLDEALLHIKNMYGQ